VSALLRNYGAFEETLAQDFVHQIHKVFTTYMGGIRGANILVDNNGGVNRLWHVKKSGWITCHFLILSEHRFVSIRSPHSIDSWASILAGS
jgi:hypothetical protein